MSNTVATENTYGNWSTRESTGHWGLDSKATYAIFVLAAVSIAVARFGGGLIAGAVVAGIGASLIAGTAVRVQGLSVYERLVDGTRFTYARLRGETKYRAGILSPLAGAPLPGYGAHVELHSYVTVEGATVGLLVDTKQHTITVIWRVDPIGEENIDSDDRDRMVAFWGVFQRDLGQYGDIAFAAATIDGYPSTGLYQLIALESALHDDAPIEAADDIRQVEEELPADSFDAQHRVAISFHYSGDWKDRIVDIARRFHPITADLHACDMDCRILRAEEIIEFVRRSYDPATQVDFDDLRANNTAHGLSWNNVGPIAANEHRLDYEHETATSASYVVWEWPKDGVSDYILHPLLEVNPRIPRKRITLLYRPETAANARTIVEDQERDAMRASQRLKRGIHDVDAINRLDGVSQSREEVSRGAGWVAQAMIITVTTTAETDTATLDSIVSDMATQCSLRVRPAAWHQASTFQYGLGIGLIPPTGNSKKK